MASTKCKVLPSQTCVPAYSSHGPAIDVHIMDLLIINICCFDTTIAAARVVQSRGIRENSCGTQHCIQGSIEGRDQSRKNQSIKGRLRRIRD